MNKVMKISRTKQLLSSGSQPLSNVWSSPVPGPLAFPLAAWNVDKNHPF